MSEVLSAQTFLKQHQKALLVCAVVVLIICVLIWLSKNNTNRGIASFNKSPLAKEKALN
jgi:Cu/Ag efflux pump CusA